MKKIDRRQFLQSGIAGLTGLSVFGGGLASLNFTLNREAVVDRVSLGKTGLKVPRIAMGTGSHGGNQESNQTRLGKETFIKMARHAWDRGFHFFDMADSYGSHTFVREVLKEVPREKATLLSKVWTTDTKWQKVHPVEKTIDRFRMETGSDYFDILLMHCLMNGNWKEEKKSIMDAFSLAKQKGIVKAVGVSCHNYDAMKIAVEDPWVDVILARINPFGIHMDGKPGEIMSLLEIARKNGKGVIGMKIFGNGDNTSDNERERSLNFALKSDNIHCITLGLQSIAHVDDAVERAMRIVKS